MDSPQVERYGQQYLSHLSLLWAYETNQERLPAAGDYWVITNGVGNPVGIILDTDARIIPYSLEKPGRRLRCSL